MIDITKIKNEGEGRSRFDQIKYRYENRSGRFIRMSDYVPAYYNPFDGELTWKDLRTMLDESNSERLLRSFTEDEMIVIPKGK